jgi:hypothetical protein
VVTVAAGETFVRRADGIYAVSPGEAADYRALLGDLRERSWLPQRILHLWSVEPVAAASEGAPHLSPREIMERGFYSLLYLAQALGRGDDLEPLQIDVVSTRMQEVMGGELRWPEKAAALGPCKVIPKEYGDIRCRSIGHRSIGHRGIHYRDAVRSHGARTRGCSRDRRRAQQS